MLSRSECVDRMCAIAAEVVVMADQTSYTTDDEQRFDRLTREFDVFDTARAGLEVGVREEHLPLICALLTG